MREIYQDHSKDEIESVYTPELESPFVTTLDYVISLHLEELEKACSWRGGLMEENRKKLQDRITKIKIFVNSYIFSNFAFTEFTRKGIVQLWREIRNNYDDDIVGFLFYITQRHRMIHAKEIDELIRAVVTAYENKLGRYSVIGEIDNELGKLNQTYTELEECFSSNPWLITIALLPMVTTK